MRLLKEISIALNKVIPVENYADYNDQFYQVKANLDEEEKMVLSVVQKGNEPISILVYRTGAPKKPEKWDCPYQAWDIYAKDLTRDDVPAIIKLIGSYVANYQKYKNYSPSYTVYKRKPSTTGDITEKRLSQRYGWWFVSPIEYDYATGRELEPLSENLFDEDDEDSDFYDDGYDN